MKFSNILRKKLPVMGLKTDKDEREISDLVLFYNLIHGRLNVDLDRYFLLHTDYRRGRSSDLTRRFHVIKSRTEQSIHYYTRRVIPLWNNLPDTLRAINPPINVTTKPQSFRRALLEPYVNKTRSDFDVENTCTWVSHCRCCLCRPI